MERGAAPDTLTFDCYGTLVDWEAGIQRAFRERATQDGVELADSEIIRTYMEVEPEVQAGPYRPYREILRETAFRVAERLGWSLDPGRASFLADSLPGWPLFPDTRAALVRLKRAYRLAILSNIDDDLLAATIQRIGVDFEWVVTAQQTRSYKPAAGHFQRALERVQGARDRLLHVAQSYFHDVRPALACGLAVVWVNRKGEVPPEGPVPTRTVGDLEELADWLDVGGG